MRLSISFFDILELYQKNSCLGMPERCVNRSRMVKFVVAYLSHRRNSGSTSITDASQCKSPSSTKVPITKVVKALVQEPIAKRVSSVTGMQLSKSRYPKPFA